MPFDVNSATSNEFRLNLRSQSTTNLSEEEAQTMLEKHGFFASHWHRDGNGSIHLYEQHLRKGIVIDHTTGLMWQQSGSSHSMTYAKAEKYIYDLNAKCFANYNNWRLPTLEEAMSLMEPAKYGDLYLESSFDQTIRWIWTGDKFGAEQAWVVVFDYGLCYHTSVDSRYSVRAVRSEHSII
ncbi:DUF1566 domain-containing protein [candidate division KSB1 bacterium]|nr:DUF1566 domain-containing protein [candidate division KSB1 bacterium]